MKCIQTPSQVLDYIYPRNSHQIKIDNGPPFQSNPFAQFSQCTGFRHRKITPAWPKANSESERFMLQTLRAAHLENKNWQLQELFLFLRNYRATPHSNTGVSPAELLFGRKLVVKWSELVNTAPSRLLIADTDRKPKGRMKAYAGTHVRRLNIAHWQLETRFSSVNHVNTNYYRPKTKSHTP